MKPDIIERNEQKLNFSEYSLVESEPRRFVYKEGLNLQYDLIQIPDSQKNFLIKSCKLLVRKEVDH